jgi:hypothetical protein
MKEDLKKFESLKCSRVRKFEGLNGSNISNKFECPQTISNNVKQQTKHG